VFEQFNDGARRCVVLAQEEARGLGHDFIGSEHLLLGLLSDGEGPAYVALTECGVSLAGARATVPFVPPSRETVLPAHVPFDAEARDVLERSSRSAMDLRSLYIGTGHILLGLVEIKGHAASLILRDLGCDIDQLRARTIELVNAEAETEAGQPELTTLRRSVAARGFAVATPAVGAARGAACSFCGRDVWELESFVASGEARICSDCVAASARAMSEAGPTDQPIVLPPRVFGSDTGDDKSVGEIVAAFTRAFDASASDGSRAEAIEDGVRLMALVRQASERNPATAGAVVRGVRFVSEEHAQVRFMLQVGSGGTAFEGEAVREGGRWLVSRSTMCRLLSMAGIPCPPR
jgi:hypothetical protein